MIAAIQSGGCQHREVCAGRMTLEQAQREMVTTWGLR
jgi:hypothetical protein